MGNKEKTSTECKAKMSNNETCTKKGTKLKTIISNPLRNFTVTNENLEKIQKTFTNKTANCFVYAVEYH